MAWNTKREHNLHWRILTHSASDFHVQIWYIESLLQTQLSNKTETEIEGIPQTRPRTRLEWRGLLQQELG